jgi:ceramide glucosyltransferase
VRWSRTLAAAYLALLTGKAAAALVGARRAPAAREPAARELDDVLVAQPVLSGDPDLRAALEDNLRALAGARFCWLVDDDDPEGQRVCHDLASGHACVDVVVCAPAPLGVNPKLWKLQRALDSADDDTVVVVLDDDTRLPRASLGALLGGLGQGPGEGTVATGLPSYLPADGLWGRLVEQFVANNAALTYLPLRPITLNGMTWAARAGDLRRLGGFEPVLHSLTDDLAVAGLVLDARERIVQTASPQWVSTHVPDAGSYARIMHRWFLFATLLLRRQPPRMVATISALHGLPPLLLWAVLLGARRDPRAFLLVLAARAGTLAAVQRLVHGRVLHRPLVSLAAELAQPLHLAHASVRRTIVWRSRTFRVLDERHFVPVERTVR